MNSEWIVSGEAPKTGHLILVVGNIQFQSHSGDLF